MRLIVGCFVFILLIGSNLQSQIIDNFVEDESMLYAHTKQVNQFFRRFNGEENRLGVRSSINDSLYQNNNFRKEFINFLFDEESTIITPNLKLEFINDVTDNQSLLDFHGGNWFAQVKALFLYKGEEKTCTIFLKLQEEEVGSKWVLTSVLFEPFTSYFINTDSLSESQKRFLHPLSHELDFMNLFKVFKEDQILEQYVEQGYTPDYLTLFIYEFRKSNLKFKTILDVKFHLFQINNWYFELSEYNRKSYNSGWLISNLLKITEEDEAVLKKFIYQK
ncbi:MAG: hypothetical protein GY834_05050 [Bacteroidetes bacterium]|nr:hypothetical protein [Bacteroidota bacterium]